MRRAANVCAAACLSLASAARGADLSQVAFIAGSWQGEENGVLVEERWMEPRAGCMLGVNRTPRATGSWSSSFCAWRPVRTAWRTWQARPAARRRGSPWSKPRRRGPFSKTDSTTFRAASCIGSTGMVGCTPASREHGTENRLRWNGPGAGSRRNSALHRGTPAVASGSSRGDPAARRIFSICGGRS